MAATSYHIASTTPHQRVRLTSPSICRRHTSPSMNNLLEIKTPKAAIITNVDGCVPDGHRHREGRLFKI
ncbi:hypothetical protein L2E82_30943 [Cichorium intybus]|uniref:Uncharacterized protein n=1 Tax=Cichorium intybus TaxID=13427 RepID=A0ACB9D269_CICIN|nr:hypothetical protein L2E82_30943 [Cichorium intybus]